MITSSDIFGNGNINDNDNYCPPLAVMEIICKMETE
jgi:hypothetical protein